jgi:hypothetical protein
LINELLEYEDEDEAVKALEARASEITQAVVDAMTQIIESLRQNDQPDTAERLEKLQGFAMEKLMETNWRK